MSTSQNKKVTYIYDRDVGDYSYGQGHVMKPHRIRVAHSLIMHYGLHKHMEVHQAKRATELEMTQFHTDEYINHLKNITPEMVDPVSKFQNYQFNLGPDCPVFEGLFDFSSISAGGSLAGASRLNRGNCDIAVNWAGGLHHAKKSEASGFCYVNDIVLAILELLRFHKRVLYIDIDVHHGDGVEEAFYTTDRVMTVSFHKYGEFFPGTGELSDIGVGRGKNHAVNVPLADGIDDWSYQTIFQPIIQAVIEYYRPEAIVLQCGADSLSGDRLGSFNLSMDGHATCVEFVKNLNLPLLVLGGGGYNVANTSRAWAYETGVVLGRQQSMKERPMPYHKYYGYFAPEYELDIRPANITNDNSNFYLSKIRAQVLENLRDTCTFAPSVPLVDVPRDIQGLDDEADDVLRDRDSDGNKDTRRTQYRWEKRIESKDAYISDSDDEEENIRYNIQKQPDRQRQRNIVDSKSPDIVLDQEDDEEENTGYNIQEPPSPSRQPHITDLTNRGTVSTHGNNAARRIPSSEDIKIIVAICKARKHRPKFRLPKGATPRK